MDSDNGTPRPRPPQGDGFRAGQGDWRSQSLPCSRQEIAIKIFDTLKTHRSSSGQEELPELMKIAAVFEENVFTSATSQWDYLQKISTKMFTVEAKSPNTILDTSLQANSSDSPAPTRHANEAIWQEEVYQKIKDMKEMYLPELSEMYQKITNKIQQHEYCLSTQAKSELEKLKMFKTMLERVILVLQVSKSSISPSLKDKLCLYEKQIINFISTNRPRKPVLSLQQGQLSSSQIHNMQPSQFHSTQVHLENQMNPLLQNNMTRLQQNSVSSVAGVSMAQENMLTVGIKRDREESLEASRQVSRTTLQQQNSTGQQKQLHQSQRALPETPSNCRVQTGNATVGDWQEEVFQKIKVMKEMYLLELTEIHQKIITKLPQLVSLPEYSERSERLKMFKTMIERLISTLQISKNYITPGLKDKWGLYEKQILNFIDANRPRKQIPSSDLHSTQQPYSQCLAAEVKLEQIEGEGY
ncbi:mediator of RNA polymerase II transcription subunit 15a-like isoform X2 [Malus sylvestris]|uniref:mediator of RNA polymerase II transcription subunit 15a-like isoform X2 n=1 Tax=Malus sylvestris TaxID=3752 RepID=UPI0021ACAF2C|nr:mediator of RNA polymerase II transcription subunit 15a-like isoform X2 [Malus sylvestris]